MQFRKVTLEVIVQDVEADIVLQAMNYALERIEERVTVIWSDLDSESSPKSATPEQNAAPLS